MKTAAFEDQKDETITNHWNQDLEIPLHTDLCYLVSKFKKNPQRRDKIIVN